MPSGAATIVCEFEQYAWRVTVKTDGSGAGHITPDKYNQTYVENGKLLDKVTATVDDPENYRFVGWYKGYGNNLAPEACTELVTTNASAQFTAAGRDLTFVAKFASRRTTLRAKVTGNGTFDLYVNGSLRADNKNTYTNTNARDGQQVRVIAFAGSDSYFSNWEVPSGTSGTDNIYQEDVTRTLPVRSESVFTATFKKKTQVNVVCSVTGGKGKGTFGSLGTFTDTSSLTAKPYEETEYSVTATETNKLYGFSKWQYRVGSTWYDVKSGSLPNWIRQVQGSKLVVYIKGGDTAQKGLRAVFYKKTTYTVPKPTIAGDHPINKNQASAPDSGCSVSMTPATADEGTNKWLSGTRMSIVSTAGGKWIANRIEVVFQNSGTKTFSGTSASFTLTENVTAIRAIFYARQYSVSVTTAAGSEAVASASGNSPTCYFEYHPVTDPGGWEQALTAQVYVDTPIRLRAATLSAYSSSARFRQWFLNGVNYSTTAGLDSVPITGTSVFSAQFASRHIFSIEGSQIVGQETQWFGEAKISYKNENGAATTATLPSGKTTSMTVWLTCGTTFSLDAKAKTTTGATPTQGYFQGWFERGRGGTWSRIDGWGTTVSDTPVGVPRAIRASFDNQEVWPILRLRNPPGGAFCAFAVSGVRLERAQTINVTQGGSTVERTITLSDPNDYFCDPFSIVQIRLDLYDTSTKFQVWQQMEFGQDDPPVPGTSVLDPNYAQTQDLSVFMTGNTYLMPIFWTGTPVTAIAGLTDDNESTFGDVSLEGDFIEQVSEQQGTFMQGATATFVASPRNGYRFEGWYGTSAGVGEPVSRDARFQTTMNTTRVYYARFVQDRNAIYTFGTGTANKTLHWRSRRVTTAVPVSFSTAQVDVEGTYDDVNLTVYHSSSPDVPYEEHTYTVKDGNSRRIKLGERAEKCFEFEVETSHPVNFMGVGTSVNALLSGGQA